MFPAALNYQVGNDLVHWGRLVSDNIEIWSSFRQLASKVLSIEVPVGCVWSLEQNIPGGNELSACAFGIRDRYLNFLIYEYFFRGLVVLPLRRA